jgi:hypothetical protein
MSTTIKSQLMKSNQQVMDLANLLGSKDYAALALLGANSGFGFSFKAGDVVTFPLVNDLLFQVKSRKLRKEDYKLLYVGVAVNDKPQFIPVWALRKRPTRKDNLPIQLSSHDLYMEIMGQENDIERCLLLAGATCKVSIVTVTEQDDQGRNYDKDIFVLEVISREKEETPSSEKPKKGKKA